MWYKGNRLQTQGEAEGHCIQFKQLLPPRLHEEEEDILSSLRRLDQRIFERCLLVMLRDKR